MNKLTIKYQYITGVILTVLTLIAFVQTIYTVKTFGTHINHTPKSTAIAGKGRGLATLSPNGNLLASADADGKILLWDAASGQVRMTLQSQPASPVNDMVFSPDGATLASVSDRSIQLWDVASGTARLMLPKSPFAADLVFSPNGNAIAALDQDARIMLWNAQTGSITQVLTEHQNGINAIAFSPDSKVMAIGGQNARIGLWDMATSQELPSWPGNNGAAITNLKFSPDGKALAAIGEDASITLWDAQSGSATHVVASHQNSINAVAFSPDSKILASGSQDAQVKLWDTSTGIEQASLQEDGAVTGLVFGQDNKSLASVCECNTVFLWDVPTLQPKLLTGHMDWVVKAAFIPNQKSLVSVDKSGLVVTWDLLTGQEQLAFQAPLLGIIKTNSPSVSSSDLTASPPLAGDGVAGLATGQNAKDINKKLNKHDWKGITALAMSPDGTLYGSATKKGEVKLWTATGEHRFAISGHHGGAVTGVVFSADGKSLISVGQDTQIQIMDVVNGNVGKILSAHEHPIRTVAASPNGKYIASAGEETRVMIWDAQTGKLARILSGHTDFVNALSFSADGAHLASAGADGHVLIWDVKTGLLVQTLAGHSKGVNAVAFSPEGQFLASGGADSLVILWDGATGQKIQSLVGHKAPVRAVAFSPNGQRLASTGEDANILVWDTTSYKLLKQLAGTADAISALVFEPLGNLITGSEDGTVIEWDVDKSQKKQVIDVSVEPQANNSKLGPVGLASVFNLVLDWIIPSAEAAIPNPPGGPILVVTTASDPFGQYYAEILRTEGLNSFAVADISTVTQATLSAYDVVILAKTALTAGQVSMFTNWVNVGGNLIAMRPDKQLASLLGLVASPSTLVNSYLLVDTSRLPGNGIAGQTMQFHGTADLYSLGGASGIAMLYSNATTALANPAVTLNNFGAGKAAAFTYDLASSIIYTRQGNPSWATQERDGVVPIRSDDKFFGNASFDPQSDWVDLNKVAIPQADEQQRLFANLIIDMDNQKKPLPRFWYFPNGEKAVVVMTGDDHGNGGTGPRFDQFKTLSPPGCSVANWECVRGTSYIYTNTPLTNVQAASYTTEGFEVGLHINTNCADYTPASLETFYNQQISSFTAKYTSIPAPITQRHHCVAWSDWVTGSQTQLNHGMRLDTTYYFFPPGWVGNQPGIFSGSAMPMRFTNLDGSLIDVYNVATQMTDESGQQYPYTVDTLLDRALGDEGYFGSYVLNAHTDAPIIPEATLTVSSAQAHGVPVVSGTQLLTWLDARNASSFGGLTWNSNNTLSFAVAPAVGANGLQAMLPLHVAAGVLVGLKGPGNVTVAYTANAIKGVGYAFFPATAGAYVATYAADTTQPTVLNVSPANGATGVNPFNSVTVSFNEDMMAETINGQAFQLRDTNNALVPATVVYNAGTKTAVLDPSAQLTPKAIYTAKIKGGTGNTADVSGNTLAADFTWSFTTGDNTVWATSTTPAAPSVDDPASVELGVKFKVDFNGFITAVRFYKGTGNTGTHIGNLWSSTGALLATATFVGESAAGWQQVNFASPVAVSANTVYVASYFAPKGHYAGDNLFFANSGVDNPPLHLLQDGVSGGNGVYALSGVSAFPNLTYQSTNYWVDVVFTTNGGPDTTPPIVTSVTPADGVTGVVQQPTVTATFSEAIDPATVTGANFQLQAGSNPLVPATVSYNAATRTASLTPSSSLAGLTLYTARALTGIKDMAGNAIAAPYSWTFTTASGANGCAPSANAIVTENCKAGSLPAEWNVSGAGDPSIQGFATDISVNRGATVSFKVKTNSNNYHFDIYRMGYYGGMGARKIATVNPSASLPQTQPACLNDTVTGLVDCGNWVASASWIVPADATSGIYFAKVVRTDTGGASHIVFIVRDDAGTSDILFQTSDTTWQAYNDYGGNSLYTGSPASRAYKVSYNRPFNTRASNSGQDWLFNAEYPMVRWLEANGYDVSYFTGVDSNRFGNLIRNHKVFLSVGHDEYWSGTQRSNVEAARNVGVHLAFFSGNEVFWKTRWENSIDGLLTANRTLVCYKETHANAVIDPLDPVVWTGSWRDPRFSPPADGGRPENALTGLSFMVTAGTANLQVTDEDGKMRFWRNTTVASLAPGTTATLADSTLGYEWDMDVDNGLRPPGLFGLSTTTLTNVSTLIDYGSNYAPSTATHHLSLYKHSSGARVFGAGTIQWSWGLDSNHDRGNSPADLRMQQATVNLLADMNTQPSTLQPGIVAASLSTDSTAPSSIIVSPVAGSNVIQGTPVVISGTATDTGGVIGGVEVSVDGGVVWHPAIGRESWSYTWTPSLTGAVTIKARAVDDSGNLANPGAGSNVNVATNNLSCTGNMIWPTSPTPLVISETDSASVELGVKFKPTVDGSICGIRFYKGPNNTGTHIGNLWSGTGSLLATAIFNGETASGWQQVNFTAPVFVTANTIYVASYKAPAGRYSVNSNYFTAGVTSGQLYALRNGESGGNGLYQYGVNGGFPVNTYQAGNYWVDVVFNAGSSFTLSSIAVVPSSSTIPTGGTQQFTATGTYSNGSSQDLTNQVTWASSNLAVATIDNAGLAIGVNAGNVAISATKGSVTRSTGLTVQIMPLTINTVSLPNGRVNEAYSANLSVSGGSGLPYTWSIISGSLPDGLILAPATGSITGTPTTAGALSFTVQAADSAIPEASVTKVLSINVGLASVSIWPSATVPSLVDAGPDSPVELGVKFRADTSGSIAGIRFYKASTNTGTHIANLWSGNGTLMTSATFTGETASGWQQVLFPTPVAVAANTVYVASYHASTGHYSENLNYFTNNGTDSPPLHALANGVSGGNGVYAYGAGSVFPNLTWNATNYWIDVVFNPGP